MGAIDKTGHPTLLDNPASGGEAVTPHDTTELTYVSRAIYVGGAGNVTALMQNGDVVLFTAVPAGTILPIRVKRINNTGTSASNMTSIY